MNSQANTVETLLEALAGLTQASALKIDSSDVTIMHSIARQVFKGTALTDRQYDIVKEKLIKYKSQFSESEYDFDIAINTLRMPLREIDRSKYIKVVSHAEMAGDNIYESYKDKWQWIKIRFPFSKKLIVALDTLTKKFGYHHDKGSHEHFFFYTEKNVWQIVKTFLDKNFDIDDSLMESYKILDEMYHNKSDYIPGVYNLELKTVTPQSFNYIENLMGKPNIKNLAMFKDKKDLLGLIHFDEVDLEKSLSTYTILSQSIVNRKRNTLMINSDKHTFDELAHSLFELQRFPLLVMLPDNNPLDYLIQIHQAFRNFIEVTESCVLFRLDNSTDADFNNYIRNNKLNNSLDKYTKVVYISTNKVPKPLLKSEWKGNTVLKMQSSYQGSQLFQYENEYDLRIQYDNNLSMYHRQHIQEI